MTTLFWFAFALVAYTYIGYPLVLWVTSARFGRSINSTNESVNGRQPPDVTILVAAHQEAPVIRAKLQNFLSIKYPDERLRMIVVSDGSSDATDTIVRDFGNPRVTLLRQPLQLGKASALARGLAEIKSEIVLFTDANVILEHDAISRLVYHFADASVGAVTGTVHLLDEKVGYRDAESLYYRYERFLQRRESYLHSVVGVDGALYAVRRALIVPPPPDAIIDDFVISMSVAINGSRIIYEPQAEAYEHAAPYVADEFHRKVRVAHGAFQSVFRRWGLPGLGTPKLLFCYISHKFLRWLSPLFLVAMLLGNIGLATREMTGSGDGCWWALLVAQVGFYAVGAMGWRFAALRCFRLVTVPMYFLMMNVAFTVGLGKALRGGANATWTPTARITRVQLENAQEIVE